MYVRSQKLKLIPNICGCNKLQHKRCIYACIHFECLRLFVLCVCASCSVHLARRVLQLERQNTSLTRELERLKSQTGHVSEEVNAPLDVRLPGGRY